jgi:hypothetical protein
MWKTDWLLLAQEFLGSLSLSLSVEGPSHDSMTTNVQIAPAKVAQASQKREEK